MVWLSQDVQGRGKCINVLATRVADSCPSELLSSSSDVLLAMYFSIEGLHTLRSLG